MPADLSHFFAEHVIATIAVVAIVIFMFLPRGGGSWIVRFLLVVMLAVWIWIALVSYVEGVRRKVSAEVDSASSTVSQYIPDWARQLWDKIKPSPIDKACDLAGMSELCNIAEKVKENFQQVSQDIAATEAICNASPAVEQRFGAEGKIMFCNRYGKQTQQLLASIGNGVLQGAITDVIPSYLLPTPQPLDTKTYLDCLYTNSTQVKGADMRSCQYTDPHLWRLCVEFHMQLPSEQLQQPPAPLEPKIQACRDLVQQQP